MQNATSWFSSLCSYGSWMMEELAASCVAHGLSEDERIIFLFRHTVNARRIWLERVRDGAVVTDLNEPLTISQSLQRAASDEIDWQAFLRSKGDAALDDEVLYANLSGSTFRQPLRDIVFHVVNHTTHHMDEVSVRLRAHGATPPPTDHIVYARTATTL